MPVMVIAIFTAEMLTGKVTVFIKHFCYGK